MTDTYEDLLEFHISQNMETKESTRDSSNVSDQEILKDFSSSWLKVQERNLIQIGDNLTNAAQNSYLVYRCISIIADNIASVPIILFDKATKDPIPETNPLYKVFNEPNPFDNFDDLMSSISTFYTLYGEAFITVLPTTGRQFEMWALDPRLMKEVVDRSTGMLLGWVYNKNQPFELDEIVQIKKRNPYNQWRGLSPLISSKIELNIDYKSSKYQESLMANGAMPGGIITVPENALVSDEEMKKMRRMWEQRHMGAEKGHKIAVLKSGLKYEPIAFNGKEMEFIDSRKFTRESILLIFGVPAVVAGLTEGVNRTSAEAQLKLFWRTTIKPQLDRIESKFNYDILPRFFPNIIMRFDVRKIDELQKDYNNYAEISKKLFGLGFSRNELNRKFDLGFDEDKETGDIKYIPLNYVDASLNIYSQEGKLGQGGSANGPNIDSNLVTDDDTSNITVPKLPISNQAKSIYDIKVKILTPKMRNFFKDEKKKLVKMIVNRDVLDKELIKDIKDIINSEKTKFFNKFLPFFTEIILQKQIDISGIDSDNYDKIDLDREIFSIEMTKITKIFDIIFYKIGKILANSTINKDETIKNIKLIYSELNFSLEMNLKRFVDQINIDCGR